MVGRQSKIIPSYQVTYNLIVIEIKFTFSQFFFFLGLAEIVFTRFSYTIIFVAI